MDPECMQREQTEALDRDRTGFESQFCYFLDVPLDQSYKGIIVSVTVVLETTHGVFMGS